MAEHFYLDTNALYAFYRDNILSLAKHPNYQHYHNMKGGLIVRRLSSSSATLYVSNLTYLEFLGTDAA